MHLIKVSFISQCAGVLLLTLVIALLPACTHASADQGKKIDLDAFLRRVTQHILDTSFTTYEASTMALIRPDIGELSPTLVKSLQKQQQLPRDMTDLRATAKAYAACRRVTEVRIDKVNQRETDSHKLIPVDVTGVVQVHQTDEDDPRPIRFKFRYLIGFRPKSQIPIVANFQDLSPPAR